MKIEAHNMLFKLERWQTADGRYLKVELPKEYRGFHFGPTLRSFILEQHYRARVPQHLLLQQLWNWDIAISEGELAHIIEAHTVDFEKEINGVLESELEHSSYIQVDDTGARDCGKPAICTGDRQ